MTIFSYATHTLDGLENWPTHIHCLSKNGTTSWFGKLNELQSMKDLNLEQQIQDDQNIVGNIEEIEVIQGIISFYFILFHM